jgi:GTP-binding protein HflX
VSAVREVLGEVGADQLPELLVINKVDAADEETVLRLKRTWPEAIFVSARSGAGIAELHKAIADRLPRPAVELRVLIPYDRGDLVARVHRTGQVLQSRHLDEGTELLVRVDEQFAAELSGFQS